MCSAVGVSLSGFYAWCKRPPSRRSTRDLALRAAIKHIHEQHHQMLGTVKTWHKLNENDVRCGKHRVARLRKLDNIESKRKAKFRVMRAHQHTEPAAANLLNREFTTCAPDQVWVSDITTIHTREGWIHLAIVLDLFARRFVGWAMDARQNVALPIAALNMALEQRKPTEKTICHTDQGSVYGAKEYRAVLASRCIRASMSRRGNCHDNAVAESFFSTLKNELTHHAVYATRADATAAVTDFIELYYNLMRPHQTLGYRSPMQVENEHMVLN